MRAAHAAMLGLALGCSTPPPAGPDVEPSSAVAPRPIVEAEPPPPPPPPPPECEQDEDCTWLYKGYHEDDRCCRRACDPRVVSRSFEEALEDECVDGEPESCVPEFCYSQTSSRGTPTCWNGECVEALSRGYYSYVDFGPEPKHLYIGLREEWWGFDQLDGPNHFHLEGPDGAMVLGSELPAMPAREWVEQHLGGAGEILREKTGWLFERDIELFVYRDGDRDTWCGVFLPYEAGAESRGALFVRRTLAEAKPTCDEMVEDTPITLASVPYLREHPN